MKMSKRAKLGIISAATAAMVGMAALPAAQASPQQRKAADVTTDKGIPAAFDPATGLAAQPATSGKTWTDSIYVNSEVKAGGHDFGIHVITLRQPNVDQYSLSVVVTDETSGWYKRYGVPIAKNDYHWSTTGLDIKMPGLTWKGNAQRMSLQATTPWGGLDIKLVPKGPALNYAGTGTWSMLGDTQYEFALPSMRTSGTLTLNGKTQKISGKSWLDRQWGETPVDDPTMRWTWMSVRLPNNDTLALWDTVNSKSENSWATVLHPDGSYDLAAVKPLADGVDKTWTSTKTGKTYATGWHVEIPSLKTRLTVRVNGPEDQEAADKAGNGVYEAPAVYTGVYEGKKVTGTNYTEQVGDWRR
ncbi:lipocalin family protein [Streptomyces hokutonensis]|uniref:lipocalin family protein n=1 Tax=Streptomyces hokutonensis TaxID=1306990 RepID=UPI0036A2B2AD